MKKSEDVRFVNIPIALLPELYNNCREFCEKAMAVGVYLYSQKLNGDNDVQKFEDAAGYLNIRFGRGSENNIREAEEILFKTKGSPVVGIEIGMLFDYYQNPKTEFEIVCLGAFLGVKSIIGKKPYAKSNKKMIFARMFGYKSPKELPNKRYMNDLQKKYFNRYQIDKILNTLQLNWGLKMLWNHNRGVYLTFDVSLEELAKITETDKRKAKLRQLAEDKRKAIEKVKTYADEEF